VRQVLNRRTRILLRRVVLSIPRRFWRRFMKSVHLANPGVARRTFKFGLALLSLLIALPLGSALAADASDNSSSPATKAPPATVAMFDGMKSGDLDVKFFPRNSKEAQLLIKNNTDKPLTVQLPDAFAGVPVLAQAVGNNNNAGGNRTSNTNKSSQNQGVGGGGLGGGIGGGGGGGGAFNVPPEKTIKVRLAVVCLDHGKDEPNAHIPYEIRPLESYNADPEVRELCVLLGSAQVDQRSAQAAAWHLANHMSWDELADMKRFPHLPAYTKPYFSVDEMRAAMLAADQASKIAEAKKSQTSSTTSANSPSTASPGTSSNPAVNPPAAGPKLAE